MIRNNNTNIVLTNDENRRVEDRVDFAMFRLRIFNALNFIIRLEIVNNEL